MADDDYWSSSVKNVPRPFSDDGDSIDVSLLIDELFSFDFHQLSNLAF